MNDFAFFQKDAKSGRPFPVTIIPQPGQKILSNFLIFSCFHAIFPKS